MAFNWFLFGGLALLGVFGWFAWWFYNKSNYKYFFLLYSRDGKHARLLKAKIINDKVSSKVKKFKFKGGGNTIPIREPTTSFNGKPCRQITYNNSGEYVYIADSYVNTEGLETIDEQGEKKQVSGSNDSLFRVQELEPTERELAARAIEDNMRRFQTIDKTQLFGLLGMLIFGILFVIGTAYITIQYTKSLGTIKELQEQNVASLKAIKEIVTIENQISERLLVISSESYNGTLIRPLT